MNLKPVDSIYSDFSSDRINLSPFTKPIGSNQKYLLIAPQYYNFPFSFFITLMEIIIKKKTTIINF